MGEKKQQGFTIIEVMLFLAITGLIMAVFLTGIGSSLNRERYRDATTSFHDYLQGQYNLVANVNNYRNYDEVCTSAGIVIDATAAVTAGRGTSDCTIVGRILNSTEGGTVVNSAQVYATSDAFTSGTDEQVLTDAKLVSSPQSDEYKTEWGVRLVEPSPNNSVANEFSIMIVRMPNSGVVRTFTSSSANLKPAQMIGQAIPSQGFKICVDPQGLVGIASKPVGVKLTPNASNSAGITFVSEGDC